MKQILAAVAVVGGLIVGGCWVPVQIDAPSENVVYVMSQRVMGPPAGRVTRCQGPGQCVDVYEP